MPKVSAHWINRERLPGGFYAKEPSAGGPVRSWEWLMFRKFGVPDRASLNRFFLTSEGRVAMSQMLTERTYRIEQPEESALAFFALAPSRDVEETLKPHIDTLRFYPRWLERAYSEPPPGQAYVQTCGDLLEMLRSYTLPLEVARKRESLSVWKPLYEELLQVVWETESEGWPFQTYSPEWSARSEAVLQEVDEALAGEILCHFPQKADSNFRRLESSLRKALTDPDSLTGREVAFCRNLLHDSMEKYGPIGSPLRKAKVEVSALPGEETLRDIEELTRELGSRSPFEPVEPATLEAPIPQTFTEKIGKARAGALEQLHTNGLITTHEHWTALTPQLTAGLLAGAHNALLRRTYLAHAATERRVKFEELPWLATLWSPPAERDIQQLLRNLFEFWGRQFAYRGLDKKLRAELQTLHRWLGLPHPGDDFQLLKDLWSRSRPNLTALDLAQACQAYIAEQECLRPTKPYLKLQRDKRVKAATEQASLWESVSRPSSQV